MQLQAMLGYGTCFAKTHSGAASHYALIHVGVVSFSARIIAAGRATETEAEQPLFQDFLAADLAGSEALENARAHQSVRSVFLSTA